MLVAGTIILLAAFLIPFNLSEQDKQQAIEFVKNYSGSGKKGASLVDFINGGES